MTTEWDVALDSTQPVYGMLNPITGYTCYNYFRDVTSTVDAGTIMIEVGDYIKYDSTMTGM